jgi:hypothetical protein
MTFLELRNEAGEVLVRAETSSRWTEFAPVAHKGDTKLLMSAPPESYANHLLAFFTEASHRLRLTLSHNVREPRSRVII